MKTCPLCGAVVHYVGLKNIECLGLDCQNYKPRVFTTVTVVGPEAVHDWTWAMNEYIFFKRDLQWRFTEGSTWFDVPQADKWHMTSFDFPGAVWRYAPPTAANASP